MIRSLEYCLSIANSEMPAGSLWRASLLLVATALSLLCVSADETNHASHFHDAAKGFLRNYREYVAAVEQGDLHQKDAPVPGVHWMAPLMSGGGYASEALAFIRGLVERGRTVVSGAQHGDGINGDYARGLPKAEMQLLQLVMRRRPRQGSSVVVCHSEPGAWTVLDGARYHTSPCPGGPGMSVGRTMFESDRLPDGWRDRLLALDETWVPSSFTAAAFIAGGVPAERIVVVPEPVDVSFFSPASASPPLVLKTLPARTGCTVDAHSSVPECPYRFLAIGKWERRKNYEALLRAFLTQFHASPPPPAAASAGAVSDTSLHGGSSSSAGATANGSAAAAYTHTQLVIVTSQYHSDDDIEQEVRRAIRSTLKCQRQAVDNEVGDDGDDSNSLAERDAAAREAAMRARHCLSPEAASRLAANPPVVVLRGIPQMDLPRLYGAVDAFVLPSRGEGWGRPHVEAMASGLPVLATNWSGTTEFLHEGNGYPLPVSHLAPIPEGAFRGHLQAEVDLAAMRRIMRHVTTPEGQAEARGKGVQARRDMERFYSPTSVAAFVEHQLARLVAEAAAGVLPSRQQQHADGVVMIDGAGHQAHVEV